MKEKYKGITCIMMSAFFFATMNIFVRLSGNIPSGQKSFFRNFVAVLLSYLLMRKKHIGFHMQKGSLKYMISRSIFGTIGIVCNFYAVDHMKVADASMLNKLSPFFVLIFSYFILKEKVKLYQALCIALAFAGMVIVIRPTGLAKEMIPSLIGIAGGISAGLAYTFVRVLGNRGEKGAFIVFFFSAFSCLTVIPQMIFDYRYMSIPQVLLLLGAGAAAAGGQFAITAAYTYAPGREISIYDYSQILFSTVLGYFILNEMPDRFSFIGYGIIIGASLIMFLLNNYSIKKQ